MQHLSESQVASYLEGNEKRIIQQMEDVFRDYHNGGAKMIPKTYLSTDKGDFRAMPAQWGDVSGIKWVSVFPKNHTLKLPTIHGTLLLNNSRTGQSIISMDCATLTAYRTAAVSALAAKYLTINSTVRTLTFIGCGYQAKLHMLMYAAMFPNIEHIKLYDKSSARGNKFKQWLQFETDAKCDIYESVQSACICTDVITTLTPSIEGYLGLDEIEHPFHINAVGADAAGKRELKDDIWKESALVVDDPVQASHSGELQYNKELPYATLADIITDRVTGYSHKQTIFDSTGLAIEDIAIGKLIHEEHHQRN